MEGNSASALDIRALSEFGALTHHDQIWVVDGRDYIAECGVHMSYGEIWLVESHDRTTAVITADGKDGPRPRVPKKKTMEGVTSQQHILPSTD